MITPENKVPFDDSTNEQADDQRSQQDVHGNGLGDENTRPTEEEADAGMLEQAYDASEPSYTLDLDDEGDNDDE